MLDIPQIHTPFALYNGYSGWVSLLKDASGLGGNVPHMSHNHQPPLHI